MERQSISNSFMCLYVLSTSAVLWKYVYERGTLYNINNSASDSQRHYIIINHVDEETFDGVTVEGHKGVTRIAQQCELNLF